MSAIFGLLNLDGQPVLPDNLRRMSAGLADLGADGAAQWAEGPVGLGYRLARVTPEDRFERQPVHNAGGQLVLVSDGRLDNRPELVRSLDLAPAVADKLPDSAFILRAYEKWGTGCSGHLIGRYAFAIWDAREQQLFAACSPLSSRPLVYHSTAQSFGFATMPRGLLALPFVDRALNEAKVADFLTLLERELDATFYRGIYRLLPGHQLIVGRAGLQIRPYWQLDLRREIRYPRDADYVAAFDELFERVVADQLRSLAPVGILLSGGLDSSSIAATAAPLLKRQGGRLYAFTEVPRAGFAGHLPPGRYADETPFVQAIARLHDNLGLNLVQAGAGSLFDGVESFFSSAEVPFRNTANRLWYEEILRRAQRQGVRVLLSGDLGNLTVSWHGSGLLAQLIRGRRWGRALSEARAAARSGQARSTARSLVGQGLLPLLPPALLIALQRRRGGYDMIALRSLDSFSAINPDFAADQHLLEHWRAQMGAVLYENHANGKMARHRVLTQSVIGDMMVAGYGALFGVDIRAPLGDVRVVEFCLALPEDQYRRNGEPRWLIRRAMVDRLPAEVLANTERGLQAADWFEHLSARRAEIAAELERLEGNPLARRVLDLARLRGLLERWPQEGSGDPHLLRNHMSLLKQGLMMGRFLRWFGAGG